MQALGSSERDNNVWVDKVRPLQGLNWPHSFIPTPHKKGGLIAEEIILSVP